MIGRCVYSDGASLGPPERGAFYATETTFSVLLGGEYPIMGMGVFETVVLVLVCDESGRPNWLPIGLFEFDEQAVPMDWEFRLDDGLAASGGNASNRWVAMWGYPRLIRDRSHSDQLIERNPEALDRFFSELARRSGSPGTREL